MKDWSLEVERLKEAKQNEEANKRLELREEKLNAQDRVAEVERDRQKINHRMAFLRSVIAKN